MSISLGPSIDLSGDLTVPPDAHGVVVFAHGSGSSLAIDWLARHLTRRRPATETYMTPH